MTPLLGTKTPSAPAGDESGGDRRAAQSLLSRSSWRGMGRQWRGMGGMGRTEPLAEHHPHQQQDHSGFHGSRETSQETRNAAVDSRSGRHGSARVTSRKTAARSLLLCALWRGMGRLWSGYGAAWAAWGAPNHCSRTIRTSNRAIRVFTKHEARDPRHDYCLARGASQPEFRGFHETRNTKHGFFSIHGFFLACFGGRVVRNAG